MPMEHRPGYHVEPRAAACSATWRHGLACASAQPGRRRPDPVGSPAVPARRTRTPGRATPGTSSGCAAVLRGVQACAPIGIKICNGSPRWSPYTRDAAGPGRARAECAPADTPSTRPRPEILANPVRRHAAEVSVPGHRSPALSLLKSATPKPKTDWYVAQVQGLNRIAAD